MVLCLLGSGRRAILSNGGTAGMDAIMNGMDGLTSQDDYDSIFLDLVMPMEESLEWWDPVTGVQINEWGLALIDEARYVAGVEDPVVLLRDDAKYDGIPVLVNDLWTFKWMDVRLHSVMNGVVHALDRTVLDSSRIERLDFKARLSGIRLGMYSLHGVDLSSWNGAEDFNALEEASRLGIIFGMAGFNAKELTPGNTVGIVSEWLEDSINLLLRHCSVSRIQKVIENGCLYNADEAMVLRTLGLLRELGMKRIEDLQDDDSMGLARQVVFGLESCALGLNEEIDVEEGRILLLGRVLDAIESVVLVNDAI